MTVDNGVRVVAGCILLLSLLLTAWVHPGFVWLSVFVGVNLIQRCVHRLLPRRHDPEAHGHEIAQTGR